MSCVFQASGKEEIAVSLIPHTIIGENNFFKIYSIEKYYYALDDFIKNDYIECELEELKVMLLENNNYHLRIHKKTNYIFFGDCDNYKENDPIKFFNLLIDFMKKYYKVSIKLEDISYTINKSKVGSYHFSIPKYYCSCEKLKEMMDNFKKYNKDILVYKDDDGKIIKVIDTSIYCEKWFILPNQTKENKKGTEHKIIKGNMEDFIVDYIPEYSKTIENKEIIIEDIKIVNNKINDKKINVNIKEHKLIQKLNTSKNIDNDDINNFKNNFNLLDNEFKILVLLIDNCFNEERFDDYESWIKIGMAINTKYGEHGLDLFDYFSSKSNTKDPGREEIKKVYKGFKYNMNDTEITIASLYYYAKEDNIDKYIEIMKKESLFKDFNITSTDIAKYIKYLRGNYFIWKNDELYCFNGKIWEKNDILLRIYISCDLYNFLKDVLITCFWNDATFSKYKNKLDKLKTLNFKKEIIETTREYLTNNNIEFDNKYYLFGFNNKVYDLNEGNFRDYKYDDYVSITTGYDWIDINEEDKNELSNIINQVFPMLEEKDLYLTILATGLEGRCLEKFTIANGSGRNGKGFINDLALKSFGNYGLIGNNAILFETNKTGSNPEKNNIDKKRLVIFREPSERSKFENSVVKELTGGGTFSSRGHHETKTQKNLYCTIIVECNKKPLFAEEPTNADVMRLIDIYFRSTFTDDKSLLNNDNYIFRINSYYKTDEFKEKYKYALLSILFDNYKKYKDNNHILNIPANIKQRTMSYLEMSCNILSWFKDNYILTDNSKDIIKMKELFDDFKSSDYYFYISKSDKRKYNYSYFCKYFKDNIFFRKYYINTEINKGFYIKNHLKVNKETD